ncbi:MAG TPA: cupin domain-containing protein [Alphaproteobacteria bacterium]|nr:cupin domain-containing protein [Alphaproteobacteria bacterium]
MGGRETDWRIVTSTESDGFRPYDRYGRVVEGLSWKPLRYDADAGTGSFLIRFASGAASLPHEHGGVEEFVVLDGYLVDADGRRLAAGEVVSFAPGSRHHSQAPEGCTLAVFLRGRNRLLESESAKS